MLISAAVSRANGPHFWFEWIRAVMREWADFSLIPATGIRNKQLNGAVSGLCTLGAQPALCAYVYYLCLSAILLLARLCARIKQNGLPHTESARTFRHPNPRQLVPRKSLMGKVCNWVRWTKAAGLRTDGAYVQTGFAKLHLLLLCNGNGNCLTFCCKL